MVLNTQQIYRGLITIDDKPIKIGMSISEFENILNTTITDRSENAGHGYSGFTEDGKDIDLYARFKGDNIADINFHICGFSSEEDADRYFGIWMKERGITERIGSDSFNTYFKAESGVLIPHIIHRCYPPYGYELEINYEQREVQERKFVPIKEKANNTYKIIVNNTPYKIQRISRVESRDIPGIVNFIGDGPMSISEEGERHSKNDRLEMLYFSISRSEDGIDTVIGVAEFTYLAVLESYENEDLFWALDDLTAELGMIGHAIESFGCDSENRREISPYILLFEKIHDEIPRNKYLSGFIEDKYCMYALFQAVMNLTSKYVKIPETDITLISVSARKDNTFTYYKKFEDVYINYQRSEKNVTISKANGNASQNALKYQINIPAEWAKGIGLTQDDKSVIMAYDGQTIKISKKKPIK